MTPPFASLKSGRALSASLRRLRRRAGRAPPPGVLVLAALFGLPGLLSGCGYGFTGGQGTVLDGKSQARQAYFDGSGQTAPLLQQIHTLSIKSIEHHTLYPWLGQIIRSSLRDEIGARKIAAWVDSGVADYSLQIVVHAFTLRTSLHNEQDVSLLYSANIRLTGIIYDSAGIEVWRSGAVSYSDTYDSYNERAAAEQLSAQAVKLLVAEMRNTF
jgi:hypothetical protein